MNKSGDAGLDALWQLARDVQLRWIEQRVVEYREWLKDPFRWEYAGTEEESIDAFIAWLKDVEPS